MSVSSKHFAKPPWKPRRRERVRKRAATGQQDTHSTQELSLLVLALGVWVEDDVWDLDLHQLRPPGHDGRMDGGGRGWQEDEDQEKEREREEERRGGSGSQRRFPSLHENLNARVGVRWLLYPTAARLLRRSSRVPLTAATRLSPLARVCHDRRTHTLSLTLSPQDRSLVVSLPQSLLLTSNGC